MRLESVTHRLFGEATDRWEKFAFWMLALTLLAIPTSESAKSILFALGTVPWGVVVWRRRNDLPFGIILPWIGLVCATAFSAANAAFPLAALRGTVDYVRILVLFLVVVTLAQDPARKKAVFWIFLASTALAASVALGIGEKTAGRLEVFSLGAFDQSSYFLSFVLLLALAAAFGGRGWRERVAAMLLAAPITAAMLLSFTRVSILAAAAGFVYLVVRVRMARQLRLFLGIAMALLVVGFAWLGPSLDLYLPRNDFVSSVVPAGEERWTRWEYAVMASREHWLVGYGLKHYRFIDFGKYGADTTYHFNNAHNQYVNMLVELGLLGLVFFGALLLSFMRNLWVQATSRLYAAGTEVLGIGAEACLLALLIIGMGNIVFQFENGLAIAVCMGLAQCPSPAVDHARG